MGIFDLPNLPGMQIPGYQPRPSGIASLAEAIQSISDAQRQRKADEQSLRTTQRQQQMDEMKLADMLREREGGEIAAGITSAAFQPDTFVGPRTPEQTTQFEESRWEKAVQNLLASKNPVAQQKGFEMQTKLLEKRHERELRAQLGVDKNLFGYMKDAKALFNLATSAPEQYRAQVGGDPQAFAKSYLEAEKQKFSDPQGQLQVVTDLVTGERRTIFLDRFGQVKTLPRSVNEQAALNEQQAGLQRGNFRSNWDYQRDFPKEPTGRPKTIDDMYRSAGRSANGLPLYEGKDGITYEQTPQGFVPAVQTPAPMPAEPAGEPAPTSPSTQSLPPRIGEPPRNTVVDKTLYTEEPQPMKTPMERKAEELKIRNEQQMALQQARLDAKVDDQFPKSQTFTLYKNAIQPMQNVEQAQQIIRGIEAKGPGGMTNQDMANLRQADNMLVRMAATLFESKTGVVREGEVISLLGDETLGQAVYKLMEKANFGRGSIEAMSPDMREAFIAAANAAWAERERNMEEALKLASPRARAMVQSDLYGRLRSYAGEGGTAPAARPSSKYSPNW